jgi:hypothetical protein
MFERYTEKARRVIFFARYEASQFGSHHIETEHLLLGILREDHPLANRLLRSGHLSVEAFRREVAARHEPGKKVSTSVDLPLSLESKRALTYAAEESEGLAQKHIDCEHLVLGLLREDQCFAAEVLGRWGITLDGLRSEVQKRLESAGTAAPVEDKTPGSEEGVAERVRDLRDILGRASQYRAEGALWGAGYVRKCQSVVEGQFHWERRPVKPRDALVRRDGKGVMLNTGESYDAQVFELVKEGWKHDHCVVCWQKLYNADRPEESFGYTNGAEWLCQRCYDAFLAGKE